LDGRRRVSVNMANDGFPARISALSAFEQRSIMVIYGTAGYVDETEEQGG
jgi:hypothetical protein